MDEQFGDIYGMVVGKYTLIESALIKIAKWSSYKRLKNLLRDTLIIY